MVMRPRLVDSALTEPQARAILHTIRFPGFEDEQSAPNAALPAATLSTLTRLQIHFLLSFPFEALAMNYEPEASMAATLEHTYSRFIEQRHGGGYCLQVNLLYRELLAFLRFRFIGVLGRVYSPISETWTGLTHTASLVYLPCHLEEGKYVYYMSDVGFGSSPHRPILLREGWEEYGRGSDKFRLVKLEIQPRSYLEQADDETDDEVAEVARSQVVWKLQNRKSGKDWEDCYSFATTQCFTPDYLASNCATSSKTAVPFASMILVVRYLLEPTRLAESAQWIARDGLNPDLYAYHPDCIEQRMVVGDKHIVKLGDQQTVFRTIETEEERIELLKSDFGLLHHVDTQAALREIRAKPSALNPLPNGKNHSS
ncbi:uncharacterized protein PSANT_01684 [Moesziomyces antarcticus]|uniref:Uncharacterized protein n=2 Tax=Pseudozyma antarctica TaxID=84753 RepID=A0A5C3FKQ1_PSEA2|nr:uncharacterized protein PSANT_01684 [Moesziomyces antarcticus]